MKLIILFLNIIAVSLPSYAENGPHSQDNQNQNSNQQINCSTIPDNNEILAHFFKPIKYTHSSITCFLRHTYNHNLYASQFLAFNFSHLSSFLSYTNRSKLPYRYINSILGLFRQKLKSINYINAYAFYEFLSQLSTLTKDYFNQDSELRENKEVIKECLYSYLLNNFDQLKQNPDHALDELSEKICDITVKKISDETDIPLYRLQQETIMFLELGLNKLIWSPQDQEKVWESVKQIAHTIETLQTHNIIPNIEMVDELYWSLIYRFCYFLDIAGSEFNNQTYRAINKDLSTEKLGLWTLAEREPFITSKLEHLQQALLESEIKSQAYKVGIIPGMI